MAYAGSCCRFEDAWPRGYSRIPGGGISIGGVRNLGVCVAGWSGWAGGLMLLILLVVGLAGMHAQVQPLAVSHLSSTAGVHADHSAAHPVSVGVDAGGSSRDPYGPMHSCQSDGSVCLGLGPDEDFLGGRSPLSVASSTDVVPLAGMAMALPAGGRCAHGGVPPPVGGRGLLERVCVSRM